MGWKSVSWRERMAMKEAPVALVEPTKQVVRVALQRLKKGKVDAARRKRVYLELRAKRRVYEISDVSVDDWKYPEGSEARKGHLSGGLFVYLMELDEKGTPLKRPDGIQSPRLPELVTQSTIFILRGILPEAMTEVAEDLDRASLISEKRWDDLVKKAPPIEKPASAHPLIS